MNIDESIFLCYGLKNDYGYRGIVCMAANGGLHNARHRKDDEFYTRLADVTEELKYYEDCFRNKIVLCNCDDPKRSAFWKYFHLNFAKLGLRGLVSTHYGGPTYRMAYTGGDDNDINAGTVTPLLGNGDFRSRECLEALGACDIIVTNPPFSLFQEYMDILIRHGKKFLIVGPKNAVQYAVVFRLFKYDQIRLDYGGPSMFGTPSGLTKKVSGLCRWFTNLDVNKRHEPLVLSKAYCDKDYPKYDYIDAIEVSRVSEIPCDYYGLMGVPLTFMDKYDPDQFELVDCTNGRYGIFDVLGVNEFLRENRYRICSINGVSKYSRILIRRKS